MPSGLYSRVSRGVTVLFIDDDEDLLFAYQLVATESGMNVALARDGYEALALASTLLPDVIVLDLGLRSEDGLNGLEVARRLRASKRTSSFPIVIVSGSTRARDMAEVQASGCDGHLVKPCSADDLVDLINSLGLRRKDNAASEQRGRASAVA